MVFVTEYILQYSKGAARPQKLIMVHSLNVYTCTLYYFFCVTFKSAADTVPGSGQEQIFSNPILNMDRAAI